MKSAEKERIASVGSHFTIFSALLLFLAMTFFLSYVDLRSFNFIIALLIAMIKATLVALYFMEVRHSKPITRVFVAAGLVWFLILISLAFTDYVSRSWNRQPGPWPQRNFGQY